MRVVAAITLLMGLLAGCGQTGPLYLPGEAPTPQPTTPVTGEPAAGSEPGSPAEN